MGTAYYLTISECPLVAWEKRFKKGNHEIRKPDVEYNYTDQSDYDAWDKLYIDWEENVKQDPSFLEYQSNIELLNKLLLRFLKSEVYRQGITIRDRSIRNEIRRVKALITKYEKNLGQGQTINQTLQILSKNQGYHIRKNDLTVEDYFDLIEMNKKKHSDNG